MITLRKKVRSFLNSQLPLTEKQEHVVFSALLSR